MTESPERRYAILPPAERVRKSRSAVRVIVRSADQVLLFRDSDPAQPGKSWWVTPGGGIDPGESPTQAAVRELWEETGLVADEDRLCGPVGHRLAVHGYSDEILEQTEEFYLLDVDPFEVSYAAHTEEELATLQGHRWWPVTELRTTREWIWPAALLALIDRGESGEGPLALGVGVEESTLRVDEVDAVILGGGTGRRLGGLSKPDLVLDGRRLLDRAIEAVQFSRAIAAVVPDTVAVPAPVRRALEEPPMGGPAAGVAAGLDALAQGRVPSDQVLLLACDLPGAAPTVPRLLAALGEADGACLIDQDGHQQWLAGVYRRQALRHALADGSRDRSMHSLLSGLRLVAVAASTAELRGIDTPDDLRGEG